MAQTVKCLPAMWEIWVQSLGQEDFLEKEMGTHSSILAWKIPRMEEPDRLQSMGSQRVRHDLTTITNCVKCSEEKLAMCYVIESWGPSLDERGPGKAFLSQRHLS